MGRNRVQCHIRVEMCADELYGAQDAVVGDGWRCGAGGERRDHPSGAGDELRLAAAGEPAGEEVGTHTTHCRLVDGGEAACGQAGSERAARGGLWLDEDHGIVGGCRRIHRVRLARGDDAEWIGQPRFVIGAT